MGKAAVEQYLTFLTVEQIVPPSTQNQAFSALLYFWGHVLEQKLPAIQAKRAQPKTRLPVVLSQQEVAKLPGSMLVSRSRMSMPQERLEEHLRFQDHIGVASVTRGRPETHRSS